MSERIRLAGGAPRALQENEVASLLGSMMASIMTGPTPPETVRRAMQFQLENFDMLVRAVAGLRAGKTSQQIAQGIVEDLHKPPVT